ncbi:hypothetical protein HDE_13826 [Halotydeus destructor]|nr:hypothetical protein HDE_13826 [Halotydeus destructor]
MSKPGETPRKILVTDAGTSTDTIVKIENPGRNMARQVEDYEAIAQVLSSTGSVRLRTYAGEKNENAEKWLREFDAAALAANWNDESKSRKFRAALKGSAENWCHHHFRKKPATTFTELRAQFEKEFIPLNARGALLEELGSKVQGDQQMFVSYAYDVLDLCDRADISKFEEQRHYILKGAEARVAESLYSNIGIETIEDLIEAGRRVDEAKSMGRKTGHDKQMEEVLSAINKLNTNVARERHNGNGHYRQQSYAQGYASFQRPGNGGHNNGHQNGNHRSGQDSDNARDKPGYQKWYAEKTRDGNGRQEKNVHYERRDGENGFKADHRTNTGRIRCYVCGEGHAARFCPNNQVNALSRQPPGKPTFIAVTVNGKRTNAFVDPGSGKTLVTRAFQRKLGAKLHPVTGAPWRNVDGDQVRALGEINAVIKLELDDEKVEIPTRALVMHSMHADVLLGNDFNCPAGLVLDCRNNKISLTGAKKKARVNLTKRCLRADEAITIGPKSRVIAVVDASPDIPKFCVARVSGKNLGGLEVPSMDAQLCDGQTQVEVINTTKYKREICPGQILAVVDYYAEEDDTGYHRVINAVARDERVILDKNDSRCVKEELAPGEEVNLWEGLTPEEREKFKAVLRRLTFALKNARVAARLCRHALELSEFDFKVVYRDGKSHRDADFLSRFPLTQADSQVTDPELCPEEMFVCSLASPGESFKEAQENDPQLAPVIKVLQGDTEPLPGKEPFYDKYTLLNGLVYRASNCRLGPSLNLCVPKALREQVLYACHDDPFGAHLGVKKTLDKVHSRYHFPGLRDYVQKYVASCLKLKTSWRQFEPLHRTTLNKSKVTRKRKSRCRLFQLQQSLKLARKTVTPDDEQQVTIEQETEPEITFQANEMLEQEAPETDTDRTVPGDVEESTVESLPVDEEVAQPIAHRLTRARKKVSPFQVPLVIMALAGLLTGLTCSFHETSPVVWRETDIPVVTGTEKVTVYLKYDTACDLFKESKLLPPDAKRAFLRWCEDAMKTNFFRPIEAFCPGFETPNIHGFRNYNIRVKRLEPITTGLIILGFASVGFSGASVFKSWSNGNRIDGVEARVDDVLEQIKRLSGNDDRIKSTLERIEQSIEETARAVNDTYAALNQVVTTLPETILIMSHVSAELISHKPILLEAGRRWKAGQIDPQLFTLFNVTLNCTPGCPLESARPVACSIDRDKELITLQLTLKRVHQASLVLRADPFKLMDKRQDTGYICQSEYVGPRTVIFNRDHDCVTPISYTESSSHRDGVVLQPSDTVCSGNSKENSTMTYWHPTGCHDPQAMHTRDLIQVKQAENRQFIYCPGRKITIYNHTVDCPEFVFDVPDDVTFKVDQLAFKVHLSTATGAREILPTWSQKVNFRILPAKSHLNLIENFRASRKLIEGIDTKSPHILWHHSYGFPTGLVSICLTVVAIAVLVIYMKKKQGPEISLEQQRIELRSLAKEVLTGPDVVFRNREMQTSVNNLDTAN